MPSIPTGLINTGRFLSPSLILHLDALHDWTFPNKMTLCTAMHWWFLVDEVKEVCPLWYLTSTDLHNCKNGRRNLSNLKTIMTTLIDECRRRESMLTSHLLKKSTKSIEQYLVHFSILLRIQELKLCHGIHPHPIFIFRGGKAKATRSVKLVFFLFNPLC